MLFRPLGQAHDLHTLLGDDRVERHVVGLRVDRREFGRLQAYAENEGARREVRERAVEVAAAIAEPLGGPVPADKRAKATSGVTTSDSGGGRRAGPD